jgi:hypothetical protein
MGAVLGHRAQLKFDVIISKIVYYDKNMIISWEPRRRNRLHWACKAHDQMLVGVRRRGQVNGLYWTETRECRQALSLDIFFWRFVS